MGAKVSILMPYSQIAFQTEQLLWKKFLNRIFSLECDEMTTLWANDSLNSIFYVTISNSIAKWTSFVKEMFLFDV